MATSLTRGETKWAGSVSLTSKSKTLTLNTADKYVDKDNCPCGRYGKYFKIYGRIKNAEIRGCSDTYEKN